MKLLLGLLHAALDLVFCIYSRIYLIQGRTFPAFSLIKNLVKSIIHWLRAQIWSSALYCECEWCVVPVSCVRKAVSVPVCSRSQWTVNTRGIWQSSRPCQVSLHSTHEEKNVRTCAVKMSRSDTGRLASPSWRMASQCRLLWLSSKLYSTVVCGGTWPLLFDTVCVDVLKAPLSAERNHVLKPVFNICFCPTVFA